MHGSVGRGVPLPSGGGVSPENVCTFYLEIALFGAF